MSRVYGMTMVGSVRHVRKASVENTSLCGLGLCNDLLPWDEYGELPTCKRCIEKVRRTIAGWPKKINHAER